MSPSKRAPVAKQKTSAVKPAPDAKRRRRRHRKALVVRLESALRRGFRAICAERGYSMPTPAAATVLGALMRRVVMQLVEAPTCLMKDGETYSTLHMNQAIRALNPVLGLDLSEHVRDTFVQLHEELPAFTVPHHWRPAPGSAEESPCL